MSWLTEGPLSRIGGSSYAAQGARAGSAFGPIGLAIGALGGWLYGRQQAGRLQSAGSRQIGGMNDRLAQGIWGSNTSSSSPAAAPSEAPMSQFAGFGAGVDPGRAGGGGAGGPGGGEGYDLLASGSIMPTGSASMGYSAAGGGFGGGVWQGGGGTHVTYVNPPTGGGGIAKGKGKENGVNPN